jgi:methionyl-tRNA formyltransferase
MSSVPLRVAFFGLPLAALALHRAGITPCVVALGHPDAPGARRVRRELSGRALLLGRPDLTAPAVQRTLQSAKPDVLLSWFWPRLIPQDVLRLAPRGAFGVHPSLLPRWRGPDPYFWSLLRGDSHTGVSLHRLSSDYDTGELIAQFRVPIAPTHNAWTLAKRLDSPSLALFVEAARQLAEGSDLYGVAQDDEESTQAPLPGDELSTLRWHDDAQDLVNQVRALAPHPGAATILGDDDVEVLAASVYPGKLPRALEAGDAVLAQGAVVICAGNGGVVLERVRTDDGRLLSGSQVSMLFPSGLFRLP